MVGILAVLIGQTALAIEPLTAPNLRRIEWEWQEGREPETLVIKFSEESGIIWDGEQLVNLPKEWIVWTDLLSDVQPRFSKSSYSLEAKRRKYDSEERLSDLRTYVVLEGQEFQGFAQAVENDHRIEHLYLAYSAQPPPIDIPPETPSFVEEQGYLAEALGGFDTNYAKLWPGGDGAGIVVVDIEYSWDPTHEDLVETAPQEVSWGWNSGDYAYHGNGVLGQLIAADNGYGVTGMIPAAEALIVPPYSAPNMYVVADAIENATDLLVAGDVILIEQQAYANGDYCPVEIAPAIFDVIQAATAQGIVVVEAGGNGYQDLDADYWDDWFDRSLQDSGAIMVGGGHSPLSNAPRTWAGSSYGTRIDLQGWYGEIATVGGTGLTDLFYPESDLQQAYTGSFGGTSGASPMVVAAVAIANSVSLNLSGEVWEPLELREALRVTGIPQPEDDPYLIGPQPDMRRFLWAWGLY